MIIVLLAMGLCPIRAQTPGWTDCRVSVLDSSDAEFNSAELRRDIDTLAAHAIRERITPGLVVIVGRRGKTVLNEACGFTDFTHRIPTNDSTIYDMASNTKAFATTLAAMRLVQSGALELEAPIDRYLSEWPHSGALAEIKVGHLLAHTPGFDMGAQYAIDTQAAQRPGSIKVDALTSPKFFGLFPAGHFGCYTDLGPVIVGWIAERLTGSALNTYLDSSVYAPLGLHETRFYPLRDHSPFDLQRIAPTSESEEKGYVTVHDPIAAALGGVAGNAGMFSSARDLELIAQELTRTAAGTPSAVFNPATLRVFLLGMSGRESQEGKAAAAEFNNDPHNWRGLGFDLAYDKSQCRSKPCVSRRKMRNQECAESLTPYSAMPTAFGHLGYTGPSVWIEPIKSQLYVILLMNRTMSQLDATPHYGYASNQLLRKETIDSLLGELRLEDKRHVCVRRSIANVLAKAQHLSADHLQTAPAYCRYSQIASVSNVLTHTSVSPREGTIAQQQPKAK